MFGGTSKNIIYTKTFTEIPEVNLFALAYKLFHEDFSPLDGTPLWSLYHVWFQNKSELYDTKTFKG